MTGGTLSPALALAAAGYPVFLLGHTKRPVANCARCRSTDAGPAHDPEACQCLTCHGVYAATREPDRIRAMHRVTPGGLLAIRTGAIAGIAVVDIDPRNGGRLVPDLMPATRAVRTGSDGFHLYYRHPGVALGAKLRGHPGIDIKADGGYVVGPPSIHPGTGRPYRWLGERPVIEMPPALVAACRPAEEPRTSTPGTWATSATPGRGISSPAALLAAILESVARAREGDRRRTLYGAALGVARMVAAGSLSYTDGYAALYETGRAAGQNDRDTRAAILGGFRAEGIWVGERAA